MAVHMKGWVADLFQVDGLLFAHSDASSDSCLTDSVG